jgi:hypothetical protein
MGSETATVLGLFERVAKPLMIGGSLRPFDPIGPSGAMGIAEQAVRGLPASDMSWLTVARVRQARHLCPIDALPDLTVEEWLMIVAVHDLVRATDPEVGSFLSPGRAVQVMQGALGVLAQVPAPRDVGEALARHATFASLLSIRRTDTAVHWWCGSKTFAGRKPPARLLSWPEVRRVRSQSVDQDVGSMMSGSEASRESYEEVLRALLARTPLTDLATAGRSMLVFQWTPPVVGMLTGPGRNLAMRALRWGDGAKALVAARSAAASLNGAGSVRTVLEGAIAELEAWGGVA